MRSRLSKGHCTYFTPNWESYVNKADNNVQQENCCREVWGTLWFKIALVLQSSDLAYVLWKSSFSLTTLHI